jgi:hypothetical protein
MLPWDRSTMTEIGSESGIGIESETGSDSEIESGRHR